MFKNKLFMSKLRIGVLRKNLAFKGAVVSMQGKFCYIILFTASFILPARFAAVVESSAST